VLLREPNNRQVLNKADLATILEHLQLHMASGVVTECTKVLLNCCFEPVNVSHLVGLDSLSAFASVLEGQPDEEARTAVTSIVQTICLQVMNANFQPS